MGVCFFGADVRKMLSTKLGGRVKVVFQGVESWGRQVRVGNCGIFNIISNSLTGLWFGFDLRVK